MKNLLFLFCFSFTTAFSQKVVVANERENTVYCGRQNLLTTLVEGYPCSSVVLTTDNGKIQKNICGGFIYYPATTGTSKNMVWIKNGKTQKQVGERFFQSRLLTPPIAFVGFQNGGNINLRVLKAQGGVRAYLLNSDFQAPFAILSYTVTAIRDSSLVFRTKNSGAQFNDGVTKNFNKLKGNDYLLISDIMTIGPDEKAYRSASLEFTIVE